MKTVHVEVKNDHLQRMATVRKPILAVAELIWNSLDADATEVRVTIAHSSLGGLESVTVEDNGHGIGYEEADPAFRNLGGSWKRNNAHSKGGRLLHGKAGKGRFRAFSLGGTVTWLTRFESNGRTEQFTVTGHRSDLGTFDIDDPAPSSVARTGTTVTVSDIDKDYRSLYGPEALHEITSYFALYLYQYKDVSIWYENRKVDPVLAIESQIDYSLDPITLEEGRVVKPELTIIEWSATADRALYLCDDMGFALEEVPPGIQAPGFTFTAYLKCDLLRELDDKGALQLADLHPDVIPLVDAAKAKLREHFREKSAQAGAKLVEQWKREDVYPYQGEPANPIETAERQVFDVLAVNVNSYLPDFEIAEPKSKRLSFRLLKEALTESPGAVQRIVTEVLELPRKKADELAELLERTSLAAIINAAKVVADRLDFVRVLEILLYQYKDRLKERAHLHKLLEDKTWIFGEEFALTVSDRSLTELLRRHVSLLGREELCPEPVTDEDGSIGILDLVLSRSLPGPHADRREHLVVELKRPSQPVDPSVAEQIRRYAFAVANDERFRDANTRWVFWAISNDVTDGCRRMASQRGKPPGLLHDDEEMNLVIWVKSWGEILEGCRARLRFFQEHLEYSTDDESALAKLREVHEKHFPPEVGRQSP